LPGFEVHSSRVVLEAGFLTVRESVVGTPDGDEITRIVVEHPGAVAVVPVDADGAVVLVRQYRVATGGDLLEVPAGKRDVADEPSERTAERETEEEIGMRPGRLVRLGGFWNSPGFCDEFTDVFLALDLEPVAERHELKAEERHMTIQRVALDDVADLIRGGLIVDAKSIIGLTLAHAHLRESP